MSDKTAFQTLKFHSDYEIEVEYPHRIRKIGKTKFINEWENSHGYTCVSLNRKTHLKHRIIALQFIDNESPELTTQVDHINRVKNDNRVENLRWTTPSGNSRNTKLKNSQYVIEIPKTAIQIDNYDDIELDRYWFDPIEEQLYQKTFMDDYPWRIVKPRLDRTFLQVTLVDTNGKYWGRSWAKFIRHMQDLI